MEDDAKVRDHFPRTRPSRRVSSYSHQKERRQSCASALSKRVDDMPIKCTKTLLPVTIHLTPDLVARTLRVVEDEGPERNWSPISSQELDQLVSRIEAEAGDEEVWVFAYGSLMWNPGFEVAASEDAVAFGWHRAFALRIERLRATSEAPGLMLALRPAGAVRASSSSLPAQRRGRICAGFWRARYGMSKSPKWSGGSR
jgi:cation transport protein ChaC